MIKWLELKNILLNAVVVNESLYVAAMLMYTRPSLLADRPDVFCTTDSLSGWIEWLLNKWS